MLVYETNFEGLNTIIPKVYNDARGSFFESYNQDHYLENDLDYQWVQEHEGLYQYGQIEGLHYQEGAHAQAHLARAIRGKALYVAIDLRSESDSYGRSYSILLSQENKRLILVPRGFAHGFSILENETIITYKSDNHYSKSHKQGIIFNDPKLDIDWLIPEQEQLINKNNLSFPLFKNHMNTKR